jgi:hypothetical protein
MDLSLAQSFFETIAKVASTFCGFYAILIVFLFDRIRQNPEPSFSIIYSKTNGWIIIAALIQATVAVISSLMLLIQEVTVFGIIDNRIVGGLLLVAMLFGLFLILVAGVYFLEEGGFKQFKGDENPKSLERQK